MRARSTLVGGKMCAREAAASRGRSSENGAGRVGGNVLCGRILFSRSVAVIALVKIVGMLRSFALLRT